MDIKNFAATNCVLLRRHTNEMPPYHEVRNCILSGKEYLYNPVKVGKSMIKLLGKPLR